MNTLPPELLHQIVHYLSISETVECYKAGPQFHVLSGPEVLKMIMDTERDEHEYFWEDAEYFDGQMPPSLLQLLAEGYYNPIFETLSTKWLTKIVHEIHGDTYQKYIYIEEIDSQIARSGIGYDLNINICAEFCSNSRCPNSRRRGYTIYKSFPGRDPPNSIAIFKDQKIGTTFACPNEHCRDIICPLCHHVGNVDKFPGIAILQCGYCQTKAYIASVYYYKFLVKLFLKVYLMYLGRSATVSSSSVHCTASRIF